MGYLSRWLKGEESILQDALGKVGVSENSVLMDAARLAGAGVRAPQTAIRAGINYAKTGDAVGSLRRAGTSNISEFEKGAAALGGIQAGAAAGIIPKGGTAASWAPGFIPDATSTQTGSTLGRGTGAFGTNMPWSAVAQFAGPTLGSFIGYQGTKEQIKAEKEQAIIMGQWKEKELEIQQKLAALQERGFELNLQKFEWEKDEAELSRKEREEKRNYDRLRNFTTDFSNMLNSKPGLSTSLMNRLGARR